MRFDVHLHRILHSANSALVDLCMHSNNIVEPEDYNCPLASTLHLLYKLVLRWPTSRQSTNMVLGHVNAVMSNLTCQWLLNMFVARMAQVVYAVLVVPSTMLAAELMPTSTGNGKFLFNPTI
jgi:hypothetical protein